MLKIRILNLSLIFLSSLFRQILIYLIWNKIYYYTVNNSPFLSCILLHFVYKDASNHTNILFSPYYIYILSYHNLLFIIISLHDYYYFIIYIIFYLFLLFCEFVLLVPSKNRIILCFVARLFGPSYYYFINLFTLFSSCVQISHLHRSPFLPNIIILLEKNYIFFK